MGLYSHLMLYAIKKFLPMAQWCLILDIFYFLVVSFSWKFSDRFSHFFGTDKNISECTLFDWLFFFFKLERFLWLEMRENWHVALTLQSHSCCLQVELVFLPAAAATVCKIFRNGDSGEHYRNFVGNFSLLFFFLKVVFAQVLR